MMDHGKIVIYQLLPRLFSNTKLHNKMYGTMEDNGCGKLNHITHEALDAIKKLGATHVWFTGIIEHATCSDFKQYGIQSDNPLVVKGVAGSPYAIKDYYDVAPDLAEDVPNRMQEFEDLVARCHKTGLKVIIDFVPNHVARQYQSDVRPSHTQDLGVNDNPETEFLASNNFYYLPDKELQLPLELNKLPYVQASGIASYCEFPAKVSGNDVFTNNPEVTDWYETIKLNYGVDYMNQQYGHFNPIPDTWNKMRDILFFWAGKNIDGFRCDMAEMVPVEFWNWVISQIKDTKPEIHFIAEIYNPEAYKSYVTDAKFDYLYDKVGLYDTLKEIIMHGASARLLTQEWKKLNGLDAHMLRFLENHDEQRIASRFFASNPRFAFPAMGVSTLMNKGPVMIYFGQESGEPAIGSVGFSGDDGRTSIFDYCSVPEHIKWVNEGKYDGGQLSVDQVNIRGFYTKLLNLAQNEIFASGGFYDLMWFHPDGDYFDGRYIYVFLRHAKSKAFLVVANFHQNQSMKIRIRFPKEVIEIMDWKEDFAVYGKDLLWDQKVFFSESTEFLNEGLVINTESSSIYAFELEITNH